MDTATRDDVVGEVSRYTAGTEAVAADAEATIRGMWASLDDWYDQAAVAALAAQSAQLSLAGQAAVIGMTRQYVTGTVAALTGTRSLPYPTYQPPAVRNGAPLPLVYTRPAEAFRRSVAFGDGVDQAYATALQRAAGLLRSDMSLTARSGQDGIMRRLGVTRYRRVIRPELSETGTCGLCIAAADRIYTVGNLLPIHPPTCKCITLPIIGGQDPGRSLNEEDLQALYTDAGGSTSATDLSRTRYKVNEHGELGPVIGRRGDNFRGQSRVALEDDPARAARMLERTLPTLESLEERAAAGEDIAGPLEYQRGLVAKLRGIVGD